MDFQKLADWPATPITRHKKRLKFDQSSDDSSVLSGDENRALSQYEGLCREKSMRRVLGDKENIVAHANTAENQNVTVKKMRDLHAPDVQKIFGLESLITGCSPTRHFQCPEAESSPILSSDKNLHTFRRCRSSCTLDLSWPTVEVDQLAKMLTTAASLSSISSSVDKDMDEVAENDPVSQPTLQMMYTSSSSSSGSFWSDEENKQSPQNEANAKRIANEEIEYKTTGSRQKDRKKHKDPIYKKPRYYRTARNLLVLDCRYPYEYHGGHIQGAVNIADWPSLRRFLFGSDTHTLNVSERFPKASRTTFVLHCEFSSQRAPKLFNLLRNHDRSLHLNFYPALRYPKVYVLRGGYAAFYRSHPELCTPPGYLKMHSRPDLLTKWQKHCLVVNQKHQWTSKFHTNSLPPILAPYDCSTG
ncbi:M-phase inducer phosphatase 3 [Clonorchis sinensis]|uniref:protein-tyrosine-phosphatase n=2 Tax=Clonorchis sinensis TaxID=79923 RepID=A0A3R7GL00_CLOSI|nr:M-phase inducer phosphatase 3 [Clonorchis sinensis]